MKMILTLSLLFTVNFAQALEFPVLSVRANFVASEDYLEKKFVYNPEVEHAWIEIMLPSLFDTEGYGQSYEAMRVIIPGLTFNKEMKAFVVEVEGILIPCTKEIMKGRLFPRKKTVNTGRCTYRSEIVTEKKETYFDVEKIKRFKLFFVVK